MLSSKLEKAMDERYEECSSYDDWFLPNKIYEFAKNLLKMAMSVKNLLFPAAN